MIAPAVARSECFKKRCRSRKAAVVHDIVETYGGKITVDSEVGKGTVFTIKFCAIKLKD